MSQGEYVAPDKLEQIFKTTQGIADIFVYGDSLKSVLVAVVNLDEKIALKSAKSKGIEAESLQDLAKSAEFNKALLESLKATADTNQLKGFERIVKVHIDPTPFTDHDLITTTFKIKRNEAKEYYKTQIAKMYEGQD